MFWTSVTLLLIFYSFSRDFFFYYNLAIFLKLEHLSFSVSLKIYNYFCVKFVPSGCSWLMIPEIDGQMTLNLSGGWLAHYGPIPSAETP